jgi:polyhydroxyalkanoate synthesis regulator phasin
MEKIKKYWREVLLFAVLFQSLTSTSNLHERLTSMDDEIMWADNTQEIEALEKRVEDLEERLNPY